VTNLDLNEAIQHCQEVGSTCDNPECRREHWQLAEWLKLLKRMGDDMYDMRWLIKSNHPEADKRIREILMAYEQEAKRN
jgi:hypothetical protein